MNFRLLGKILAVASALALGGGFVVWRQGQSGGKEKAGVPEAEEVMLPGSKNPQRITVLPSSKSIDSLRLEEFLESDPFSEPRDDPGEAEEEKVDERTIFPPESPLFFNTSKSGRILSPGDLPAGEEKEPAGDEKK